MVVYGVFFFSSRRRHTRCYRDWSSDVCSSDLTVSALAALDRNDTTKAKTDLEVATDSATRLYGARPNDQVAVKLAGLLATRGNVEQARGEIGRASCRERVEVEVVGGAWEEKDV